MSRLRRFCSGPPTSRAPLTPPRGALHGVRVLDLSRVLAGPWCTQMLGDMGAEVIKVEAPGRGDDTRHWGPPFVSGCMGEPSGETSYFASANRAKLSVAVDLRDTRGQTIIQELARQSDVFIENFKVGGLAKYGLDYAALSTVNPSLIYCSITGFGQSGPRAHEPGYDFMIQGLGGLMSITGDEQPMKVGVAITDELTGMYACNGILAALFHRERTGRGQHIDVSLFDVQVAALSYRAQDFLDSGEVPRRFGNAHPNIVPYNAFATQDGHVIVAVGNDSQFRNLCRVLDLSDASADARFATNPVRVANREALTDLLAHAIRNRTTSAWVALFTSASIPHAPIKTIDAVLDDPQAHHRQTVVDTPHTGVGSMRTLSNPLKFSDTPITYDKGPPLLGEHTSVVLKRLAGFSDERIAELRRDGVVQ